MTIFEITEKVLTESGKYSSSDGKLLRNLVLENAEKMDRELLSCLLKNEETKKAYFTEVDGVQVFDKVKFSWLIQNKEFLPDSYTRYKNKIGLANSRSEFISASGDVELVFPYKDCILEGGQTKEDQKNNEIFYNETLAPDQVSTLLSPKAFCNAKRYSAKPQMNADKACHAELVSASPCTQITDTDNLIIKGNNLLALSSLLQRYRAKVKLIYIDPPYNTGGDSFGYNDNFNHSTWLVFMQNRLKLAKQLISADGCIFVQCDDNEQAYLKVLMDEIFGRENFIGNIVWKRKRGRDNSAKWLSRTHEYCMVFARNSEVLNFNLVELDDATKANYKNPDNDKRGDYRLLACWARGTQGGVKYDFTSLSGQYFSDRLWLFSKANLEKMDRENRLVIKGDNVYRKLFLSEHQGQVVETIWDNVKETSNAANGADEIKVLFGNIIFTTPKPEPFLKRIIEIATAENDLVLDFHLGSGTTAAVAHKMRRRYIGVEQMDYIETITCERLKKVISGEQGGISKAASWQGGGSFVYCELAKLNQNFVDKIQSCQTDAQIKSVTDEILKSDFVSSKVKPSDIKTSAKDYSELTFEEKQRLAFALLDKNQLYVNFSERRDPDMKLSENDIKFSESFYGE